MTYPHFHSYLGFQLVGFGQSEFESMERAKKRLIDLGIAFISDIDKFPIKTYKVNEKPVNYKFGYCDYCDNV